MQTSDDVPANDSHGLEVTIEMIPEGPAWHCEARKALREKGTWSRFLGGGAVTSSKDPSEWEHPHLK